MDITIIISYLIVIFGAINLLRMSIFLIGSDIYSLHAEKKRKNRIEYFPKFSVVIPAHNENYVVIRAIKSILHSHYPSEMLEIIIIDDGSSDNTYKLVNDYIKEHKLTNVKIYTQENSGKARALNNAIQNFSTGELVMCLDADSTIDVNSIKNAAQHFIDKKVMALSANVKIIKRKGLLNLIQRYEYLVCYQMKRAESLMNCQYIVGGIASTFRKSVLEMVNYYDTNTVTEDIDLTMKILRLGNKDYRAIYGADVIAHTESVLSVSDLIKQRFRWKWGRCQTFLKNLNMFFNPDKKHSKSLSWFYLPYAIYGDIAYFLEPIMFGYIIAISIYYRDIVTILSAWAVITVYIIFNILAENTISTSEKFKLIFTAPLMYVFFYILSFVEYVALIKSIVKLPSLKNSLDEDLCGWTHVERSIDAANL